jgi:hypothetical protein
MPRQLTQEEFITKATKLHKGIYSYKNVVYVHSNLKINITCSLHGDFSQSPNGHLNGSGCPKCRIKNRRSREEWINLFFQVHGDEYDYSLVGEIENRDTVIQIICKIHGMFLQKVINHKNGSKCDACSKRIITRQTWLYTFNERHGETYNYNLVPDTFRSTSKIPLVCKDHGIFYQTAFRHAAGRGCHGCGGTKLKTHEQFVEEARGIHGGKYSYPCPYEKSDIKLHIDCNRCKRNFLQTPDNHLAGHGCPTCSFNISKSGTAWLDELNITEREYPIPLTMYTADGYDPSTNTIYEFHGSYWHGDPSLYPPEKMNKTCKMTHGELYLLTLKKEEKIKEMGYNLVVMWESDWNNTRRFKEKQKKHTTLCFS